MRMSSRLLLTSFFVAVLCSVGAYLYIFKGLPVKNIEFKSASLVSLDHFLSIKKDLEQQSAAITGSNLLTLDLKKLVGMFEEHKQVKEARVFRRLPSQIRVELILHEASAVLLTKKNKLFPVSLTGDLLNEIRVKDYPDLPVLRGAVFELDKESRLKAVEILQTLPPKGRFSGTNISEIYKSDKAGYTLVLKSTGTEVQMGDGNIKQKVKAVSQVLKYMDDERLKGRVIDARFLKKVVVKLY